MQKSQETDPGPWPEMTVEREKGGRDAGLFCGNYACWQFASYDGRLPSKWWGCRQAAVKNRGFQGVSPLTRCVCITNAYLAIF